MCQNWRHEHGQSTKGSVWQDSSRYSFLCGTWDLEAWATVSRPRYLVSRVHPLWNADVPHTIPGSKLDRPVSTDYQRPNKRYPNRVFARDEPLSEKAPIEITNLSTLVWSDFRVPVHLEIQELTLPLVTFRSDHSRGSCWSRRHLASTALTKGSKGLPTFEVSWLPSWQIPQKGHLRETTPWNASIHGRRRHTWERKGIVHARFEDLKAQALRDD